VRLPALLVLALALTACGGVRSTGSYGPVSLSLGAPPGAEHIGIYLASARGYDTAVGVELHVQPSGPADFELLSDAALRRTHGAYVGVMAIVRPAKLVLCAQREVLSDSRGEVQAVVQALQRGYLQAQIEPDEAVAAMASEVPGLDTAAVSARLDAVAPTWTAGAPFIGELPKAPEFDASIATAPDEGN
jgi:ABC-type nitrate/sulfonate/bicarbonate transport system substrate-binding protein